LPLEEVQRNNVSKVFPVLILADEPTGSLDSKAGEEILNQLETINALGYTIVLVTHDLRIAKRCKRVIEMLDGRVVSDSVETYIRGGL
jgi:ABC-type lipoprotein export system ATPase subunit